MNRRIALALVIAHVAAGLLLAGGPASAAGAAYVVNTTEDAAGACTSGHCGLREAIIAANAHDGVDTVTVPAGNYVLTQPAISPDHPTRGDLDVTEGVRIDGAGAGATVVDGNGIDRVLDIGCDCNVTVTGLTIKGGTPSISGNTYTIPGAAYSMGPAGGGVRVQRPSRVWLRNAEVRENHADQGGGILNDGNLEGDHLVVSRNEAFYYGGGIQNTHVARLKDSKVAENEASGQGGGISNNSFTAVSGLNENACAGGASTTLDNTTVVGNSVSGQGLSDKWGSEGLGGGVSNFGSGDCVGELRTSAGTSIIQNRALWGGGIGAAGDTTTHVFETLVDGNRLDFQERWSGAGINVTGGYLELERSRVTSNSGATTGGGLSLSGSGYVSGTTIDLNSATDLGGGMRASGMWSVYSTTISRNTARQGGGAQWQGAFKLENSTVSGNQASESGGGLAGGTGLEARYSTITRNAAPVGSGVAVGALSIGDWSTSSFASTILADNFGPGTDCWTSASIASKGHNLYGWSDGCEFGAPGDVFDPDAGLGPLQSNGGSTFTHALETFSPAIDAADGSTCPWADQRGHSRWADGDGDGATACDIGAYELNLAELQVRVSGSGVVDSDPHGIWCPKDCTERYEPDRLVALTATPERGSRFAGWQGACTGTGQCLVSMRSARTVSATFVASAVASG